jgi:DNA-binding response OmpR family regulator
LKSSFYQVDVGILLTHGIDILVIEDDSAICHTIDAGWPVASDRLKFVSTYGQSLRLVHSPEISYFDAIIVDIHLPDGNGLAILREVRARTEVPLILISGSGTAISRADALDQGADDYVMKPFNIRELQARVARLVFRKSDRRPEKRALFVLGNVHCDLQKRVLTHDGHEVALTDMEVRLIESLYQNQNRCSSKSFLYKNAFFRAYDPREKTLDVYISRLRKKIGQLDHKSAECIQTVRGSGYRYSEPRR